jgi:hypothetical protein
MSELKNQSTKVVGVACFHRGQWQLLLNTAEDVENLESTWDEWRRSVTHFIREMKDRGCDVKEVLIDVNDLNEYCRIHR